MQWVAVQEVVSVAVLAFISNAASLFGTFIFDDTEAVVKNQNVLPSTPLYEIIYDDFWGTPLTHNLSHKSYRPLTTLTYRWNYVLAGGFVPWTFHAVNLCLHVIISCLCLNVCKILIGENSNVSLNAARVFAVHPVHTEAVSAIVGRADLLASLFFILSFLIYSKKHVTTYPGVYLLSSILLAGVAMFCKEYGITVLGFNIIYELLVNQRLSTKRLLDRRSLKILLFKEAIYLMSCALCLIYLRGYLMNFEAPNFQSHDNPAAFHESFFTRVSSLIYISSFNLWILIWPYWLCYDWSMGCIKLIEDFRDPRLLITILFWILLIAIFINGVFNKNIHYQKKICLSISLMVVPFLPASNLFYTVGFVIAERILYLPSMGFCLLVALGFENLTKTLKKNLSFLFSVLICVFILKSHLRSLEWRTETSLFKSALAVCPNNAKVHYNIAKTAADRGQNDEAIFEYQEAIRLYPNYDQALNNLANLLKAKEDLREAEHLLRRALKIRWDFPPAWMNLGIVLSQLKEYREAEKCYQNALKLRKNYPDCFYNLGNLYVEEERWNEAEEAWLTAISLKPSMAIAWNNLIMLNDNRGRHKRAVELAEQALNHVGTNVPSIYFNLAGALGKLGEFQLAEENFKKALSLDPNNALFHVNLGVLYHRAKNLTLAKDCYLKALELNPGLKSAKKNLQMMEKKNKTSFLR